MEIFKRVVSEGLHCIQADIDEEVVHMLNSQIGEDRFEERKKILWIYHFFLC